MCKIWNTQGEKNFKEWFLSAVGNNNNLRHWLTCYALIWTRDLHGTTLDYSYNYTTWWACLYYKLTRIRVTDRKRFLSVLRIYISSFFFTLREIIFSGKWNLNFTLKKIFWRELNIGFSRLVKFHLSLKMIFLSDTTCEKLNIRPLLVPSSTKWYILRKLYITN